MPVCCSVCQELIKHELLGLSIHSKWGQLLEERICSSRSKFFLLRVDRCFDGFDGVMSKKVVSFVKTVEDTL